MIIKNNGCKYHINCFTCPFEECKLPGHDEGYSKEKIEDMIAYKAQKQREYRAAAKLKKEGKKCECKTMDITQTHPNLTSI